MSLSARLARRLALVGLALLPLRPGALQAEEDPGFEAWRDQQIERGYEAPAEALEALNGRLSEAPAGSARVRQLEQARGLVAAGSGEAGVSAQALVVLDGLNADPLARADAALVRATLADQQGESEAAVMAATSTVEIYRQHCGQSSACDWRDRWRALVLLVRQERRRGQSHAAELDAHSALDLATAAGDRAREAQARAMVADALGELGELDEARGWLDGARQLAHAVGVPQVQAAVLNVVMHDAVRRGDLATAEAAGREGLADVDGVGAVRQAASLRGDLADIMVRSGRPAAARDLAMAALPVVRRFGDRRTELVALHNLALAQIALGDPETARKVLDELLEVHHQAGAMGTEAETLREFADAFAHAGDMRSALDLFHRERELSASIMAANREAVMAQLRSRYDREAQQRQMTQLERENALVSAQLAYRGASQRVWVGGAIAAAAVTLLLGGLLLHLRELNRRLAAGQEVLRAQSHCDPLTGLANRRRLQEAGTPGVDQHTFNGALLLVDVDHFKRINDHHGHAAGDLVLVEVATRLNQLVRAQDLVVRWGGEEFLILIAEGDLELAHELAGRVLQGLGGRIIELPGFALRVTVSLGFAALPLPPQRQPLSLERALDLADMALIRAKREGRNRAIGIQALHDADEAVRANPAIHFESLVDGGGLRLCRINGPVPPLAVVGSSAA